MFIVSPSTLFNGGALETRSVPKRMIGRISLVPRRGATWGIVARLIFEVQVLRYLLALAPFVIAMLIWPHLALPISQAPIPMLLLIYFVESKVLTLSKERRAALLSQEDADRTLDALNFNARRVLTRIAARKGFTQGRLHLVVEQSELARMPVLTLVSVQTEQPPSVVDLDPGDRAVIEQGLFSDDFSERQLHLVTLRERANLRSVAIETDAISAHARMAALMESGDPRPETATVAT